jgi:biopolymer transport protein ExbD
MKARARPSFLPHTPDARVSEINVTPLVDVMLVLLVIFIITAPLLAHSLKLELPEVTAPAADTPPQTLQLAIDAEGRYYWDGQPVAEADLLARLAEASKLPVKPEIQLRADKATRYERIAIVMSAAQEAGLTRLGFVTEPLPKP